LETFEIISNKEALMSNTFNLPVVLAGDIDDCLPGEERVQSNDEFPVDPPGYKFSLFPNEMGKANKTSAAKREEDATHFRVKVNPLSLSCQLFGGNDFLPATQLTLNSAGKVTSSQTRKHQRDASNLRLQGGISKIINVIHAFYRRLKK